MTDLGHMTHRVPLGQLDHPADSDRRHAAEVAEQRVKIAAQLLVRCLAAGDEGAARRHIQALRLDPGSGVDPWRLTEAVAALALRTSADGSP